jgi:antibiotic biosynthesis monooxygenase (ABM) superfamily enzyme
MATVTLLFRRRVRVGREAEYERWLASLQQATRDAPGYVGAETIRPGEASPTREYVTIVRFDSYDHLRAWEDSGLREQRLAQLPPEVVHGDAEITRLEGLEFWFSPPGAAVKAPSRHKMTVVMIPIVVAIASLTGPALRWLMGDTIAFARLVLAVTLQVVLLTYVIMPRVTMWLRRWLYR